MFKLFWIWYEKHHFLNLSIAAGLFVVQLIHLYWLTADVVAFRLIGQSFFPLYGFWQLLITLVDYTEVPALITTSLIYINQLRRGFNLKSLLFLLFLNSQWLHLFWITDEFVVDQFTGSGTLIMLPIWLAWVAILIDYLELPIIFDIVKQMLVAIKTNHPEKIAKILK